MCFKGARCKNFKAKCGRNDSKSLKSKFFFFNKTEEVYHKYLRIIAHINIPQLSIYYTV